MSDRQASSHARGETQDKTDNARMHDFGRIYGKRIRCLTGSHPWLKRLMDD